MKIGIYAVIDITLAILLLLLALFSSKNGGFKYTINRYFALFTVFVAIWIPANHISNNLASSQELAIFANYFVFSCSFGAMITLMEIVSILSGNKKTLLLKVLRSFSWPVMILAATPLVVMGVEKSEKVYAVQFGPLIGLYGLLLISMIIYTLYLIFKGLKTLHGEQRNRVKIVGLSLMISLPSVLLLSFIMPSITGDFSSTEFGITPMVFIVGGLYYAVIRHSLFDIRLAAVRSLAYILSLATLIGVYFVLIYVASFYFSEFSFKNNILNFIMSILLVVMFQPIRKFFDTKTEAFFFRKEYRADDVLNQLGEAIVQQHTVHGLAIKMLETLDQYLVPVYSLCIIDAGHEDKVFQYGNITNEKAEKISKLAKKHNFKNQLVAQFNNYGAVHDKTNQNDDIRIIAKMQVMDQDVGLIVIGGKKNDKIFSQKDISLVSAASKELSIAFQNVNRLEEINRFNSTLQEKVDNATRKLRATNTKLKMLDETKDDFMSMASHQLRTPLTSVKGYLSMLLEGDMGEVTPAQRKALEEAYGSSQRMVYLIGDFLNLSRLRTGRFELETSSVLLPTIIHQEIAQLRAIAHSRNVRLTYDSPIKFPSTIADETKIRQVMMNFIDNAIYYSKPDGGKVTVTLEVEKDDAVFTVVDSGIGVGEAEQSHLFTKFYRTPSARKARPDGTGVGLFMAKKVIDAHHGSIIFKSRENVGSTFGFRLPILDKK